MANGVQLLSRIARHHALTVGGEGVYTMRSHVGIRYDNVNVCCHDLVAWHDKRAPDLDSEHCLTDVTPDWVCDVVALDEGSSTSHKLDVLHRWGVPLVWVVDPEGQDLIVFEWRAEGYQRTHFHWGSMH